MKNLSIFLTEDKNTHLEHLEDDILNNGMAGGQNAINFLSSLSDMLQGSTKRPMNVTVKWDGKHLLFLLVRIQRTASSLSAGKSIFNKTPKINYTDADIRKNHGGGLAEKLQVALKYFPALGIPGIWQGDLLYTDNDLGRETIDDEKMLVFTPNTITYAIPDHSILAARIKRSKIGVVWHTTYSGKTMADLSAKFGANAKKLNNTRAVWSTDATFRDASGNVTFTAAEAAQFQKILNMAGGSLKKAASYLRVVTQDKNEFALSTRLKIFLNSYIRGGEKITDTKKVVARFETYYADVLQKKIDSVKSPAGKKKWKLQKEAGMKEYQKNKECFVFCGCNIYYTTDCKDYGD